jgi:hypothetical protein
LVFVLPELCTGPPPGGLGCLGSFVAGSPVEPAKTGLKRCARPCLTSGSAAKKGATESVKTESAAASAEAAEHASGEPLREPE